MILFIHIPKTAGSYINKLFQKNNFKIFDHFENYILNDYHNLSLNDFNIQKIPENIDVISGHLPINAFNLLEKNSNKLFTKNPINYEYISILRNPILRFISIINYELSLLKLVLTKKRSIKYIFKDEFFKTYFFYKSLITSGSDLFENNFFLKSYIFHQQSFFYFNNYQNINFNNLNIKDLNNIINNIYEFKQKSKVIFYDQSNLDPLFDKYKFDKILKNKINESISLFDYHKIKNFLVFKKFFKYFFLEFLFYECLSTKTKLYFKNKGEITSFFYDKYIQNLKINKFESYKFDLSNIEISFISKLDIEKYKNQDPKSTPENFDLQSYLKFNPDASSEIHPIDHYLQFGKNEYRIISHHDYSLDFDHNLIIERFL